MRYLYGDSTPFPLNTNFLETALAATDAAVTLLRLEDQLEAARRSEDDARSRSSRRLAEVDAVEECLLDALNTANTVGGAGSELVEQLSRSIDGQIRSAREQVKLWREKVLAGAHERQDPTQLRAPLEAFFQRDELPGTKWGLRWKASGRAAALAQVYAATPLGISATLAMHIPDKHLWSQPFLLGEVRGELVVQMMGTGWFGRPKLRKEALHKYYVTRVTCTADREVLVLRKSVREPSEGIKVTLRDRDDKQVRAVRIDANEDEVGDVETFAGLEATLLQRAWRAMMGSLAPLMRNRGGLLAAMLDGRDVTKVASPALLAAVFIQSVAPILRELTRHSRSSGELQLKRELGDGRREELFVTYQELTAKYADLASSSRAMFGVFGLDPAALTAPPPAFDADMQLHAEREPAKSYLAEPSVEAPISSQQRTQRIEPASAALWEEEDDDEFETLSGHEGRALATSDVAPKCAATPPSFEVVSRHQQLIPPPLTVPRAPHLVALPPPSLPPPPRHRPTLRETRQERPNLRMIAS